MHHMAMENPVSGVERHEFKILRHGYVHQRIVSRDPAHLDYYLDEFTFRFNRRTSRSRGKLFARLVEQAVGMAPTTGQNSRGGRPLA
jgi:hypothetical protein